MIAKEEATSLAATFAQLQRFYTAAEAHAGRHERFYQIAGQVLCLRFAGSALALVVTRALAHLATSASATPDLTICLAESQQSGVALPAARLPDGFYHDADEQRYCSYYANGSWQEMITMPARVGIVALDAAAHYPAYAQAAPLRNLLTWWFAAQGLYGLHAAAIGTAAGAALLVGNGGAGKSTTAVAALLQGLSYVGDDFCLLAADPTPQVHSLYCSGKLCHDSRQWLTPPASTVTGLCAEEKVIYQWYPAFAPQLAATLPVRALLLPQVGGGAASHLWPATSATAFTALVTTALRLGAWPTRFPHGLLAAAKRLVGQIPCYHLALGADCAALPPMLSDLLTRAALEGAPG